MPSSSFAILLVVILYSIPYFNGNCSWWAVHLFAWTKVCLLLVLLMLNRVSKLLNLLAILQSLFLPIQFMTGVYGMNFDNFPVCVQHLCNIIGIALWECVLHLVGHSHCTLFWNASLYYISYQIVWGIQLFIMNALLFWFALVHPSSSLSCENKTTC